ncbi:MAG TPA: DUF4382 domain-containing protein, partial [Chitinophagaceae bacterium]|nr:DUF4382 domain-containing protein [Chitinophagaceae bacterium]
IDIRKLEVKVEDNDQERHESEHQSEADDNDKHGDTSGGWIQLVIHPGVYDILQFRNGLDTLFTTAGFPNTHAPKKIRLTLGTLNSVVLNGVSFPVSISNNDNFVVIKLDESSVVFNASGHADIWIDFDAGNSIRQHGSNFELKPSVKSFSKEKSGSIEGRVLPADAKAMVMAINGTDTASAKPGSEGEFKIVGLKSGSYSLLFHATAGNYKDTTIQQVTVAGKEDTKTGTVTLHK